MWSKDYTADSTASPHALFAVLRDAAAWPEWNDGVERIEIDSPFSAGTTATMVLPNQTELTFRLAWVEPDRGFEDETHVPEAGVIVRVGHLLEPHGNGGTRITYRCVVEGPDEVGAEVGPAVSADFPDVIAALAARAETTSVEVAPGRPA